MLLLPPGCDYEARLALMILFALRWAPNLHCISKFAHSACTKLSKCLKSSLTCSFFFIDNSFPTLPAAAFSSVNTQISISVQHT
ncbi:hypothetical protein GGS21DRAFT_505167 [Xylaria nigripes]|nr:hypothetical protein GGS21DRAFT_505167 [Xylaria nigripes]